MGWVVDCPCPCDEFDDDDCCAEDPPGPDLILTVTNSTGTYEFELTQGGTLWLGPPGGVGVGGLRCAGFEFSSQSDFALGCTDGVWTLIFQGNDGCDSSFQAALESCTPFLLRFYANFANCCSELSTITITEA